jgi:hypothetical protein
VAIDYVNSKAYLAEKTFGWDRNTVTLGLNEHRTGLVCFDNFNPYLTHTINIQLKTICCVIRNLRVALHLEK